MQTQSVDHPMRGEYVRHRVHGSLALCYDVKLHPNTNKSGIRTLEPVLLVKIFDRSKKSHHQDGDHVIWSAADCV